MELIQRKITKYICYKINNNDLKYHERLKFLNLQSLHVRNNLKILKIIHRFKYNKFTAYDHLKHYYKFYDSRNGIFIEQLFSRIYFCDKNFVCNSINLFNSLPKDIRNEQKYSVFIRKCESYFNALIFFEN